MEEKDLERLHKRLDKLCKLNGTEIDLIDVKHETDMNLSFDENLNLFKEAYNLKEDKEDILDNLSAQEKYRQFIKDREDGMKLFEKVRPFGVAIVGSRDSGKTAKAHMTVDTLRKIYKLPVYTLKYPKPELLQRIGYRNLKELGAVEHIDKAILWLDEPQITLPRTDKMNNDTFEKLATICRHKEIILVISTSDTRWINRELESYVDVWQITDVDYELVKQGSRIKYIIKQNVTFAPQNFKLEKNEYLLYYRKDEQFQGKYKIGLPSYWNDDYSKPYKNAGSTADGTAEDK